MKIPQKKKPEIQEGMVGINISDKKEEKGKNYPYKNFKNMMMMIMYD